MTDQQEHRPNQENFQISDDDNIEDVQKEIHEGVRQAINVPVVIKEAVHLSPVHLSPVEVRIREPAFVQQLTGSETKKLVWQAALERKTEAVEQVKVWEQHRSILTHQHRQIVDSIWGRLQKNINHSEESTKFFIGQLRVKLEHEELQIKHFSTYSLQSQLFAQSTDGKTNTYAFPEFSNQLRTFDQLQTRQADQVKIFQKWLSEQLKEFELEGANFEKTITEQRENYIKNKRQLGEFEKEISKYFHKYDKLYTGMQLKNKKKTKDFLYAELKYKSASYKLINFQKQLGQALIQAWNQIIALETQRLQLVVRTLIDFQTQYNACYGCQDKSVGEALRSVNTKQEVLNLYSVQALLQKAEIDFIQNEQVQEVPKYLESFVIVDQALTLAHPLILKSFSAQRDIGAIGTTWQDIGIVITVDHHFLMFDGQCSRITKPSYKYPIEGLKISIKGSITMEIQFIVPGLILDSKKKYLIQFRNSDDLEELSYYLETVGQNKFSLD